MKERCAETLSHDFTNLIRKGRAHYECPRCGEDVSMILFLSLQSGIDLTEGKNLPSKPTE